MDGIERTKMAKPFRWIRKDEERIGAYRTKRTAQEVARRETNRTGRKHHAYFTSFYHPYEERDILCWTVILAQGKK